MISAYPELYFILLFLFMHFCSTVCVFFCSESQTDKKKYVPLTDYILNVVRDFLTLNILVHTSKSHTSKNRIIKLSLQ